MIPLYAEDATVECFNCHSALGVAGLMQRASGYPTGRLKKWCASCSMWTFYDLAAICGDCAHFERCQFLFNAPAASTKCDWSPSRYKEQR